MEAEAKNTNARKSHRFLRKCIGFVLVFAFILTNISVLTVFATEGPVMTVATSVDDENPLVGENFVYTLKYANTSSTESALNAVLTDVLPSNVVYVSHVVSDDIASVSVTNDGTHDVIRFHLKPTFAAGHTGIVKIIVKFPEGETPALIDGSANVAINTATIKPSNGDLAASNPVTVTPRLNAVPDWSVTTTRDIPASVLPAVDQNVTYQVTVNSNSSLGGLNLKNIVVTDTIPAGSTFVSATDGGTYAEGKVTWNIANLAVGNNQKLYIVLKYPSPAFTAASAVTNTVLATGTQFDDTAAPDKTATETHGFTAPVYNAGFFTMSGRQSNDRYSVGQTAQFTLDTIKNTGNVPLDKIEITDTLSADITLTQISTGSYSSNVSVQIQYKSTVKTAWTDWTGTPFVSPSNTMLSVSELGLGIGERVTQVRWIITDAATGQIQSGFSNTAAIKVNGTIAMPASGNTITNTATLQAFNGADPVVTKNASKDIYVIAPMPWLVSQSLIKDSELQFDCGDVVEFIIRIKNHDFATGNFVNPIAVDTISPLFEDITYQSWDSGNSSITTAPVIDLTGTKVIGGITYSLLKANIAGTLAPGEYIDLKFTAKIKDHTTAGYVTNSLYISTAVNSTAYENPVSELITDTADLDGDAAITDRFVKSDAKIFVNFTGSLETQLLVKGENDAGYSLYQYPDCAQTLAGGLVNYRLTIKNSGTNGPVANLILIDKLPTIDDTGVVDVNQRNTKWTPYLVNLITGINGAALPAGIKVYYSTVENPTAVELEDPLSSADNSADLWSLTPPVDITTVKSIKIDFGNIVFDINDEVTIEWSMRAPVGAPVNLVAWNSFGYSASYPDADLNGTNVIQSAFLPSEPLKTGTLIQSSIPPDAGNFVWEDMNKNGIQDTGEKGINGVLVNLYRKNGDTYDFVGYTRTGNDQNGNAGYYLFPNTPPGTYRIEFVYPKSYTDANGYTSDYFLAPYSAGTDRTADSNGNPETITDYTDLGIVKNSVLTPEFTLNTSDDKSIDLGLYRLGQIGDTVWYDANADGIYDSGSEAGLAGVSVSLLDSAGAQAKYGDNTPVAAVTTNALGAYLFTGLEPGIYKVRFDIPAGYRLSSPDTGEDDTIDSDSVKDAGATATTATIFLQSGEADQTVDMGVYLAHIGNLVFNDQNADGLKNGSDTGIEGVTVNLYKDGNAAIFKTTTTNSSGMYSFDDLFPGSYAVEVIKPAAYDKFSPTSGTTPVTDDDNDVGSITGITDAIIINAGDRIDTIDAGLYRFASIGDTVWDDINANGIQDEAADRGVNGVTVSLYRFDGTLISTAVTGNDTNGIAGKYVFGSVIPGSYYVQFSDLPAGYSAVVKNAAADDALDSDVDAGTLKTDTIALASGQDDITLDMGIKFSSNPVKLIGKTGSEKSTDTLVLFGDKDRFEYAIEFDVPENCIKVKITDDLENAVRVSDPVNDISVSFAGVDVANLFDISYDTNTALVTVEAKDPEHLTKGRYAITIGCSIIPNADLSAYPDDIISNIARVEINQITETTNPVDVRPIYSAIGNYVWIDGNKDGIRNESADYGVNGVAVQLFDKAGTLIAGTVTANNAKGEPGYYLFSKLNPGEYYVRFSDLPEDFIATKQEVGDDSLDSDVNPNTLATKVFTLRPAEDQLTWDMGIYYVNPNPKNPDTGDRSRVVYYLALAISCSTLLFGLLVVLQISSRVR